MGSVSQNDPDGTRLPIKIDSTSNGEYAPMPVSPGLARALDTALHRADDHARRRGLARRNFLISSCGVATTLLTLNQAHAAAAKTGGFYDIPAEAGLDEAAADDVINGTEFIFDVQGHYVNPQGAWLKKLPASARPLSGFRGNQCVADALSEGGREYLECLNAESFIHDVFMDSDTDMMVLSFVPSRADAEPLTIEEADATRRIVDAMEGDHRLLLHGRVNPNQDGDIARMDELAETWKVSAWKTYTQWGPDGQGFFLSDPVGRRMIEKARALGIKNIAIHKGLPFGQQSYEHSTCRDIGVVALDYPDVNFIIYHSGLDPAVTETAFQDGAGRNGIDTLVQSLKDNDVAPGSNVYAELGSTWRILMRDPDQAAHALGKLINACGPQNVLWGTDSIWYGSPQDQIQAFRTFQISEEFQDRFGYPALTPEIKAGIFGLNATKPYGISAEEVRKRAALDGLSKRRADYVPNRDPHFRTFGPKTRREFLRLRALQGDGPA